MGHGDSGTDPAREPSYGGSQRGPDEAFPGSSAWHPGLMDGAVLQGWASNPVFGLADAGAAGRPPGAPGSLGGPPPYAEPGLSPPLSQPSARSLPVDPGPGSQGPPGIPTAADPQFATDEFRMFRFKVDPCPHMAVHDWTKCPFAHPGEKARRRDPQAVRYMGVACLDFRKGLCKRGDACPYAHGVFECWLHPSRYRVQRCKDGPACARQVCFFAHSDDELRTPTPILPPDAAGLYAALGGARGGLPLVGDGPLGAGPAAFPPFAPPRLEPPRGYPGPAPAALGALAPDLGPSYHPLLQALLHQQAQHVAQIAELEALYAAARAANARGGDGGGRAGLGAGLGAGGAGALAGWPAGLAPGGRAGGAGLPRGSAAYGEYGSAGMTPGGGAPRGHQVPAQGAGPARSPAEGQGALRPAYMPLPKSSEFM